MNCIRILLLLCSLSLPATTWSYPSYYRPTPRPAKVTYYHAQYCNCYQCYPGYYDYDCPYCYDCYGGCPECDRTAGKVVLIAAILGAAAYLIDRVINS